LSHLYLLVIKCTHSNITKGNRNTKGIKVSNHSNHSNIKVNSKGNRNTKGTKGNRNTKGTKGIRGSNTKGNRHNKDILLVVDVSNTRNTPNNILSDSLWVTRGSDLCNQFILLMLR
jgi:hypothetical protein